MPRWLPFLLILPAVLAAAPGADAAIVIACAAGQCVIAGAGAGGSSAGAVACVPVAGCESASQPLPADVPQAPGVGCELFSSPLGAFVVVCV